MTIGDAVVGAPPTSWQMDADEVVRALGTDATSGLAATEAQRRLAEQGPNELDGRGATAPWTVLLVTQFANTMILVLGAAAIVTVLIGELQDTLVIGAIVVINGMIGFVQEYRADRTMAALRSLTATTARVVRDGDLRELAARELVVGDVVTLTTGDVVPADLRLVAVASLRINEAALTGEAEPVSKATEPVSDGAGAALGDRRCMAFRGTAVTYGRGTGVVVATGMATELGTIAAMLQGADRSRTPLQQRLAALGRRMAGASIVVCAALFAIGVARGEAADEMFVTAVSLAVAAIPEGLPAVVTVALALGARRMADHHALVRSLAAVETLGSVTVICTDKTGTLTQNTMFVERLWTPGGQYEVTGSGYAPAGALLPDASTHDDPWVARTADVAASCNDARLHPPDHVDAPWSITGDPMEGALLAFAGKLGRSTDPDPTRVAEVAFDADRRRMLTVHTGEDGHRVAVKGGLDALAPFIARAELDALRRAEDVAASWASEGYRVLALADRHAVQLSDPLTLLEHELHLVGVVAITDPPRQRVEAAVETCKAAGVRVVMITGDHVLTAAAIARRLGISTPDGALLTGGELDDLDDDELAAVVDRVEVYARTDPAQKLRIVDAWKRRGAIVAMTGDGVNDAPALRRADIGVAMGDVGTDVSKEAADMVLTDDDLTTIVHAVEEGRRIYDNIRRFVRYMLTTNSGELWVMFLAPLLGLPVPLAAVQILWVNLVTDGLPAVALGLEPADATAMRRPPRRPDDSILSGGLWQHALWVGLLMAAVTLPVQTIARAQHWPWQTMVFTTLALLQLGHALAVRSELRSFRSLGWRSNPWLLGAVLVTVAAQAAVVYLPFLQPVFRTSALAPLELAVVGLVSCTVFVAVELEKWFRRARDRRHALEQ